jgi:cellobiose phosphorylase
MADNAHRPSPKRFNRPGGLAVEVNANGSLRHFACGGLAINLFVGNELEGGPTNLYLRRLGRPVEWTPLLGPRSPTHFLPHPADKLVGVGVWRGIEYSIVLTLAEKLPAWFWYVSLVNTTSDRIELDLIYAQDLALAPYAAVRMNEFYVSQYIDHTPLNHPTRGHVVVSRQNQAVLGRHPASVIGSLGHAASFATDALDIHGLAHRAQLEPTALSRGLPGRRLQHEHSMVAIQEAPLILEPGARLASGFFGVVIESHPEAASAADLRFVDEALACPEAAPVTVDVSTPSASTLSNESLFSSAPALHSLDLDDGELIEHFGSDRRHEELGAKGEKLSFFTGDDAHVVLRAKEVQVLRPHGHLLRTGRHATPDETSMTSTVWMNGVFHSMLTQGHVSLNRCLSTARSYLGLFRSHGLRVFVELDGSWHLLELPSAFEMRPQSCRWIYRHADGVLEVLAQTHDDPHEMTLSVRVLSGAPARFLFSHHIALNGDDGAERGPVLWRREGDDIVVVPRPQSELANRFPSGQFRISPAAGTHFQHVGGDELLFRDGVSRSEPYLCILTGAIASATLSLRGELIEDTTVAPLYFEADQSLAPELRLIAAPHAGAEAVRRLVEIAPWFAHNAFVHYLAPRGLEQFSGGGWGTRDVCQGPVELLLGLGRADLIRDILLRVMRAQEPNGDWPQWFMFFERERSIRAQDSHGDIVFWPILALAQYLIATGDGALLEESVPFFEERGESAASPATVREHVERALNLIERRVIDGTALAAYGHGDWNDALQPADPSMREHMCSSWTVTLHYQTLATLARGLRIIGRGTDAERLKAWAAQVKSQLQRLLIADGVLTGYALFHGGRVEYLLHPSDATTGVRYSALAMIHAILEDLLTPEQARDHLQLLREKLSGPDGVRLFDRPLPYHGGPQRIFQRAESASFFGREIGLMYMHAHLRYAQALAHVGDAEGFFHALCQANPIGLRTLVPSATLRQSNCYYSSSDAAFADRYEASAQYERMLRGEVALEGGWRVYSSGAGIAVSLIMRRWLGLDIEAGTLRVDPVMPRSLSGMCVGLRLLGRPLEVTYQVKERGAGVESVELNGASLPFTREVNPHRPGAARIQAITALERMSAERNVMTVYLT